MPSKFPCGQNYNLNHAMHCKRDGFIDMRHNNVRDFWTNLLTTIQNDVEIEPALQKIDNESIEGHTGDEARLDIRVLGEWWQVENAFSDIRSTNVKASSQKIKLLRQYWKSTRWTEKGL